MQGNGVKIDEIDLRIVELIKQNGRVQNNEIASKLCISEGTVRNRIKKLIESNFLTIRGLVNPDLIKNKQVVFLGIQVSDIKDLDSTAALISSLPNVIAVYMITGRYDFLVELFIETYKLLNFLSIDLAKIPSIASSESFITLKTYNKWI